MSKPTQFTGAHFPDLNSNSDDNLINMKLDLNISTKVKFSSNDLQSFTNYLRQTLVFL